MVIAIFRLFKLPGKKRSSSVSKYGKNNQMRLDMKTTVWDFFLAIYLIIVYE